MAEKPSELQKIGSQSVIEYETEDGLQIRLSSDLIKKYLVKGRPEYVSIQEIVFFANTCKALKMNPFVQDCYLIKYTQDDPAAIIQSIDFIRYRARQARDNKGWRCGIIYQTPDGQVKESNGLLPKDCELLGAFFEAQPEGWSHVYRKEVNLNRYIKRTRDGRVTRFWEKECQPEQIMKVAESQGLRALWPKFVGRVYTPEEIDLRLTEQDKHEAIDVETLEGQSSQRDTPAHKTQEQILADRAAFMASYGITNEPMFSKWEQDTALNQKPTPVSIDEFRKYYLYELDDKAMVVEKYREYVERERKKKKASTSAAQQKPPVESGQKQTQQQQKGSESDTHTIDLAIKRMLIVFNDRWGDLYTRENLDDYVYAKTGKSIESLDIRQINMIADELAREPKEESDFYKFFTLQQSYDPDAFEAEV